MKKIIKAGSKKITECETCGCRFSYDWEDVDGNQHDGFWVTCPQCNSECSHDTSVSAMHSNNKKEAWCYE